MASSVDVNKPKSESSEDGQRKDSPLSRAQEAPDVSPKQSDSKVAPSISEDSKTKVDEKNTTSTNAQPLAPPPKPAPTSNAEGGDYFNSTHGNTNFNLEPNPFEQSFGNNSSETPGKTLLPSVASLTSPSSLLAGGTPNWSNSLRSGPLSPAMLTGPTGSSDYFSDSHFRNGFPTPNESSLRTGLTPGGGGSMFPAQSPNSQAFFNMLQSGGATPSTLDFQRTAMSAAAKASQESRNKAAAEASTSNATDSAEMKTSPRQTQSGRVEPQGDSYHDANDAANGLYMLAQANGARNNSTSSGSVKNADNSTKASASSNQPTQFAVPAPPAQVNTTNAGSQSGLQSQDTSPTSQRGSRTSIKGEVAGDFSESGQSEQTKPATRSRGKKGGNKSQTGNRRKADDTPAKTPANKKAKTQHVDIPSVDDYSDDDETSPQLEHHPDGRKMTDEEKRKNFLERNRVAALKCRQRKKQWLQSLQAKVEYYSTENESLGQQVASLREEILNLKTIIIAHKDCPITQQQGLSGMALANLLGDFPHHAHPYGMSMQNGMQNGMPPQGFSMAPAPQAPMHRS